jgi:N-dimethylarginine dimethylaminohydrolase
MGAALYIFGTLKEELNKKGYKFALVVDGESEKRNPLEQMLFMHLDTFSNPVGKHQIAVCLSEAKRRTVKIIEGNKSNIKIIDTKKTFLDYLFEDGQEIISIPEKEQQSFGCNFLAVDETTILVPLQTNKQTIDGLKNVGKKVQYVHLDESTKGFGAAHCMTGQLLRQSKYAA